MNVSGILVVTRPERLQEAKESLDAMDGVDVHYIEAHTGRLIATIEAPTIRAEADLLARVQALPDVGFARLVHHHFAGDPSLREPVDQHVPAFLND